MLCSRNIHTRLFPPRCHCLSGWLNKFVLCESPTAMPYALWQIMFNVMDPDISTENSEAVTEVTAPPLTPCQVIFWTCIIYPEFVSSHVGHKCLGLECLGLECLDLEPPAYGKSPSEQG